MSRWPQSPLDPAERELARRLAQLDPRAAPSPQTDAAILAAARAAAGTGAPASARPPLPPRRRPRRWPVGLGIAASLALALGVAWQLRPLPDAGVLERPSETGSLPAQAPAAASGAGEASTPARPSPPVAGPDIGSADDAPAARTTAMPRRAAPPVERASGPGPAPADAGGDADPVRQARAARAAADQAAAERSPTPAPSVAPPPAVVAPPAEPPAPAPPPSQVADFVPDPPATAPPAPPQSSTRREAELPRPRQRQAAPALAAPSPAVAAPAPAPAAARAAPAQIDLAADQPLDDQPPASADSPDVREAWLQRIRELRDDGRLDQARDSLHEFVRRHPQATVPDDLRPLLER
ncbi:MAG: hypothetical protein GXY30_08055 [Xanthomonadaceae bacterium]|nr:hypothetical protein [Xanthomonadaceae bacterium]